VIVAGFSVQSHVKHHAMHVSQAQSRELLDFNSCRTITFETVDLESSFLICRHISIFPDFLIPVMEALVEFFF